MALNRLVEETAKVPSMFWHELRNLLLTAERRGRIDRRHTEIALARLRMLRTVSLDHMDDREVMTLARSHRLTA